MRAVFLLLFCFCLGALSTWLLLRPGGGLAQQTGTNDEIASGVERAANPTAPPDGVDRSRRTAIVSAAERVSPAVVTVSVRKVRLVSASSFPNTQDEMFNRFLRQFAPQRVYREEFANMGSGVILQEDGYIITNGHVVDSAEEIEVVLGDGRRYSARSVATDPFYDLALLKIEGDDLPVAPLGKSDDLVIGEWAIAIGNPFGYMLNNTRPSVTAGVISALHRDILQEEGVSGVYKDMIQTDAAINPGNSGGPLVNGNGEVIGINTFIFTRSGGSSGVSFATPIDAVRRMVDEVLTYGEIRRVWVGVRVVDITRRLKQLLGLPSRDGVIVSYVDSESPAEMAGVEMGDIIVAINGEDVHGVEQAQRALYGVQIGDELTFRILREGGAKDFTLIMVERENRRGDGK